MANLHLHPFIHASSLRPKRSWRIRSPSPSHQRQWWGWLLSIFFSKTGVENVTCSSGIFRWWFRTHFFVLTPWGNDPYISQVGGSNGHVAGHWPGCNGHHSGEPLHHGTAAMFVGDVFEVGGRNVTMTWIFWIPWWIGELVVILGYLNLRKLKKVPSSLFEKNYSFNEVGFTFQPIFLPQKWHFLHLGGDWTSSSAAHTKFGKDHDRCFGR